MAETASCTSLSILPFLFTNSTQILLDKAMYPLYKSHFPISAETIHVTKFLSMTCKKLSVRDSEKVSEVETQLVASLLFMPLLPPSYQE